jgi:hypothetical protein
MNYYVLGSYAAPFSVAANGQACYQSNPCGTLVLAGPNVHPYCQCSR